LLNEAKKLKFFFLVKKDINLLGLRNKMWGFNENWYFESTHKMSEGSECYFVYTGCSESQFIEIVRISI